ncbi:hypothetical protein HPB47_027836, partial [Ixodes persulcatus]
MPRGGSRFLVLTPGVRLVSVRPWEMSKARATDVSPPADLGELDFVRSAAELMAIQLAIETAAFSPRKKSYIYTDAKKAFEEYCNPSSRSGSREIPGNDAADSRTGLPPSSSMDLLANMCCHLDTRIGSRLGDWKTTRAQGLSHPFHTQNVSYILYGSPKLTFFPIVRNLPPRGRHNKTAQRREMQDGGFDDVQTLNTGSPIQPEAEEVDPLALKAVERQARRDRLKNLLREDPPPLPADNIHPLGEIIFKKSRLAAKQQETKLQDSQAGPSTQPRNESLCEYCEETASETHVFWDCPRTQETRWKTLEALPLQMLPNSFEEWVLPTGSPEHRKATLDSLLTYHFVNKELLASTILSVLAYRWPRGERRRRRFERDVPIPATGQDEYKIILPRFPPEALCVNSVFLHADLTGRPYRAVDFRDGLRGVVDLNEVVSLGQFQMSHDVKLKLLWLPSYLEDKKVVEALAPFGTVRSMAREKWRVPGMENMETQNREVCQTLHDTVTSEDIPHLLKVYNIQSLLVMSGRPPLCLRCKKVPEEDKPRCVAGCVDVLLRSEGAPTRSRSLEPVIDFLATSGLRALVSDKEGFFVIMPEDMFAEKATCAVQKNFKAVLEKPAKVKERAVELLERLNLKQVCAGVKKEKNLTLEVSFAAKTHKAEIPFRTIVSERDTWLRVVSGYLKKNLDTLNAEDPF